MKDVILWLQVALTKETYMITEQRVEKGCMGYGLSHVKCTYYRKNFYLEIVRVRIYSELKVSM